MSGTLPTTSAPSSSSTSVHSTTSQSVVEVQPPISSGELAQLSQLAARFGIPISTLTTGAPSTLQSTTQQSAPSTATINLTSPSQISPLDSLDSNNLNQVQLKDLISQLVERVSQVVAEQGRQAQILQALSSHSTPSSGGISHLVVPPPSLSTTAVINTPTSSTTNVTRLQPSQSVRRVDFGSDITPSTTPFAPRFPGMADYLRTPSTPSVSTTIPTPATSSLIVSDLPPPRTISAVTSAQLLNLSVYKGTSSENVELWALELRTRATSYGWTDDQLFGVILSHVTDTAKTWVLAHISEFNRSGQLLLDAVAFIHS